MTRFTKKRFIKGLFSVILHHNLFQQLLETEVRQTLASIANKTLTLRLQLHPSRSTTEGARSISPTTTARINSQQLYIPTCTDAYRDTSSSARTSIPESKVNKAYS